MSVIVKIIGENDQTDEYLAAERLRIIICDSVPATAIGEIVVFPSATLFGQAVKDVDLLMIGHMKNYSVQTEFNHNDAFCEEEVLIESFCTTIEVKSHTASGIRREGTNWKVRYKSEWHNVTKQSNDQRISAKNFFINALGDSPFITNLIWFTEVTSEELKPLEMINGKTIPSNVLPDYFDFSQIGKLFVLQRIPWLRNNRYTFECGFGGNDVDAYSRPLALFSKAKEGMGNLTRKKIEQITSEELSVQEPSFEEGKMSIFRGRAGAGKTIDLIKLAIRLVDEKSARVQILTYNRALVSDIRRLFALADLPDMFEEKCVSVNTMQSYFYGLISGCLYDGKLNGEEFLSRYEELIQEMLSFLKSDEEAKPIIREICEDNPKLNWEYIFIDEAQDWSSRERDLILLLFEKSHLLIADGGKQFVRMIEPCDWTVVSNRENIKLKYCLRQKRNIIKFINQYATRLDDGYNKIVASDKMSGGHVIILRDKSQFYDCMKRELKYVKKVENIPYDMLYLVPSTLVKHEEDVEFSLKKEFEHRGLLLWDGTNESNRLDYAVNPDEARVLQYESARGLEGWTVCCLDFDEFIRIKEQQYNPENEGNALFLESSKDRKNKYMLNWALIPMTRAIDTLIITLKDEDSEEAKAILELAAYNSDYIEVI